MKIKILKNLIAVLCAATMAISGAVVSVGAVSQEEINAALKQVEVVDAKIKKLNQQKLRVEGERKGLIRDFDEQIKKDTEAYENILEKIQASGQEDLTELEKISGSIKSSEQNKKEVNDSYNAEILKLEDEITNAIEEKNDLEKKVNDLLEQAEKERLEKERQQKLEKERLEKERQQKLEKERQEKERQQKLEKEKAEKEKLEYNAYNNVENEVKYALSEAQRLLIIDTVDYTWASNEQFGMFMEQCNDLNKKQNRSKKEDVLLANLLNINFYIFQKFSNIIHEKNEVPEEIQDILHDHLNVQQNVNDPHCMLKKICECINYNARKIKEIQAKFDVPILNKDVIAEIYELIMETVTKPNNEIDEQTFDQIRNLNDILTNDIDNKTPDLNYAIMIKNYQLNRLKVLRDNFQHLKIEKKLQDKINQIINNVTSGLEQLKKLEEKILEELKKFE